MNDYEIRHQFMVSAGFVNVYETLVDAAWVESTEWLA
jgi:hypothetical protein